MESMDELIAWAIENKEWVFSAVCAVAGGLSVLLKWLLKKPAQATVSNTASAGGVVAQTINHQAIGGGAAIVPMDPIIIGAPFHASPIADGL